MVRCCVVKSCASRQGTGTGPNLRFHSLPANETKRRKWLEFINSANGVNDQKSGLICEKHFLPSDYNVSGRLLPDAVPSLYLRLFLGTPTDVHPDTLDVLIPKQLYTPPSISINDGSKKFKFEGIMSAPPTPSFESSDASTGVPLSRTPVDHKGANYANSFCGEPCESNVSATMNDSEMLSKTASQCNTPISDKKRYIGTLKMEDFETPRRARRNLELVKETMNKCKRSLRNEKKKTERLRRRLKTVQDMLKHLKKNKLLVDDAVTSIEDVLPGPASQMYVRALRNKSGTYCPELRAFALTLHFHSVAAFKYVRKVFKKLLPDQRTVRKWYAAVDGTPGFTQESINGLKSKSTELKLKGKVLAVAIMADEMHIKHVKKGERGQLVGLVDLGLGSVPDNGKVAKEALVFMAVCLHEPWKLPLGYFLIDGLTGSLRSRLITECMNIVLSTGCAVSSLTFDGNNVNLSAATSLGALFDYGTNWKPSIDIIHNDKNVNVPIILDACHMLKLMRNTMSSPLVQIFDGNGNEIKWSYLEKLVQLQNAEGLLLGNKLRKRHINIANEKQKVSLAVQTLSRSVSVALDLLQFDYKHPDFADAKPTSDFILVCNDIFDVLNSRGLHERGYKCAVNKHNIQEILDLKQKAHDYISGLQVKVSIKGKWSELSPLVKSRYRTGPIGLLSALDNVIKIFDTLVETKKCLRYIATYRLSQDHLETFFSAIRCRGGWRNNPNAIEFQSAYKKLLVNVQLCWKGGANCWPQECITILHTSSTARKRMLEDIEEYITEEENDEEASEYLDLLTCCQLSLIVEDVIGYIAGSTSRSVARKWWCAVCCDALFGDVSFSRLLDRKNIGGLVFPSKDVFEICKYVERYFRHTDLEEFSKPVSHHVLKIFIKLDTSLFTCLSDHILDQDPLNNHRTQLTKRIIQKYLETRINHECKNSTEKMSAQRVRTLHNKLVIWAGQ